MANWICCNCNWKNFIKWEKCAKCGMPKFVTDEDAELFSKVRSEIRTLKDEIEKYRGSVAGQWEYLQVWSDDIGKFGGLGYFGLRGWELVAVTSFKEGGGVVVGGIGGTSYEVRFLYVFKRPFIDVPAEANKRMQLLIDRVPAYLQSWLKTMENI